MYPAVHDDVDDGEEQRRDDETGCHEHAVLVRAGEVAARGRHAGEEHRADSGDADRRTDPLTDLEQAAGGA